MKKHILKSFVNKHSDMAKCFKNLGTVFTVVINPCHGKLEFCNSQSFQYFCNIWQVRLRTYPRGLRNLKITKTRTNLKNLPILNVRFESNMKIKSLRFPIPGNTN